MFSQTLRPDQNLVELTAPLPKEVVAQQPGVVHLGHGAQHQLPPGAPEPALAASKIPSPVGKRTAQVSDNLAFKYQEHLIHLIQ